MCVARSSRVLHPKTSMHENKTRANRLPHGKIRSPCAQGHEYHVLRGAERYILHHPVPAILCLCAAVKVARVKRVKVLVVVCMFTHC